MLGTGCSSLFSEKILMSVSPPFHWKCTLTTFGNYRCSYTVKPRSDPAVAVGSQHCLKPSRIQVG